MKKLWEKLWQKPGLKLLLGIPLGGFLFLAVGAAGWGAFNASLHYSSTNEFCFGCHIGMDTVVEEYQESIHYKNVHGVVATCADCHVPEPFFEKMEVKITSGIKDIYKKYWVKEINLENFEQEHRLRLAEHVWKDMQEQKSATCQKCHDQSKMDLAAQPGRASRAHDPVKWEENGESCVDCHYGIAHNRPTKF
ncbi:NapC/NirT family cytochrome c [Pelagibaculum spongiae]|uniref:Cytochrome c-type protein n=1 Tax=Pelagibaculum spongiae TaxID=2080658 RepID=A0A2V1GUN4_9GAMM|nr:NapC/NirT family cytochrome c [Pelagibaculum spongiae]PVZ66387.1 cytochrome C [Pelagibaculum spongiae]